MFGLGLPELTVLSGLVILLIVPVLPLWMIFSKAGFSGAWSLTVLCPVLLLIPLFYVAFSEWPVHQELKRLKAGAIGRVA
jgi:hypothetical protein